MHCACEGLKCSHLQIAYTETSQKIEKRIKLLDIIFIKVIPILGVWPAFIASVFTHFTGGAEGSALELAYPMWYG